MSSLLVLAGYYVAAFLMVTAFFTAVELIRSPARGRLRTVAVIVFGVTAYLVVIVSPRTACSIESARIGQVHGVIGSLNGALSHYFAEQGGWHRELGALAPEFMATIPVSPWGGRYFYRADAEAYIIACPIMRYGKPGIAIYDSMSGRVDDVF